ncbi:MAG: NAD(P)H-dependent oxidoreductase [Bacteroidia bacterium]|nr:NAD(P)H-dependent oxidoreductase [Bacteroidia bacterium]
MKNRCTLIQASSRSNGDTGIFSNKLRQHFDVNFVDLNALQIGQYDYEEKNRDDDFIPTISNIINISDTIILLTPIYWYTMSGLLKTFLDRFTDLLKNEISTGRKLRGMNLGYMSVSNDENLSYDFEMPIRMSADYLGMKYLGHEHFSVNGGWVSELSIEKLKKYMDKLTI